MWRPLKGLKVLENQLFLLTMKYTTLRNFKWRMTSKWLEDMKDKMKSMNANKVWDLKIIPKGAKTVGCK